MAGNPQDDATSAAFARLRMSGSRFEAVGLPVAALPEVIAYGDLILELAKALFFTQHAERQRVPKGFEKQLGLRLTAVERGSVTPVLTRELAVEPPLPNSGSDEYVEARDLVSELLRAAASDRAMPSIFSAVPRRTLSRFGQTLQPGEGLQVGGADASWSPPYTRPLRRQLLLRLQDTYTSSASLVGVLADLQLEALQASLRTDEGHLVTLPYDRDTFRIVKQAVDFRPERRIMVEGAVVFDRSDNPLRLETVENLSLAEDQALEGAYAAVRAALFGMQQLESGWLDGQGEAVEPGALELCMRVVDGLEAAGLASPRVYPTPEGGLSLEWSEGTREVQAEVVNGSDIIFGQSDTASDASTEIRLSDMRGSLDEGLGWLRQHLGGER